MANFKEFKDLRDFNRPLNEDDWNSGQQFVFKLKNSMKNDKGKCVSNKNIYVNLNLIFIFRISLLVSRLLIANQERIMLSN